MGKKVGVGCLVVLGLAILLAILVIVVGGMAATGTESSESSPRTNVSQVTTPAPATPTPAALPVALSGRGTSTPTEAPATLAPEPTPTPEPTSAPESTPTPESTPAPEATPSGGRGEVLRVIDGDTIEIRYLSGGEAVVGHIEKVRYLGIDTPETREPGGSEATEFNRARVEGQTVRLVRDGRNRGSFGRLLRHVFVVYQGQEIDLVAALIAAGHVKGQVAANRSVSTPTPTLSNAERVAAHAWQASRYLGSVQSATQDGGILMDAGDVVGAQRAIRRAAGDMDRAAVEVNRIAVIEGGRWVQSAQYCFEAGGLLHRVADQMTVDPAAVSETAQMVMLAIVRCRPPS